MTAALNYARALHELHVTEEAAETAYRLLKDNDVLKKTLQNPQVTLAQKKAVIDKLFPKEVCNLMKLLCKKGRVHAAPAILKTYAVYAKEQAGVLSCELSYVTKPTEEQLAGIRSFLLRQFGASDLALTMKHSPSLLGGFILRAGDKEYDWSIKGRLQRLAQQLDAEVSG